MNTDKIRIDYCGYHTHNPEQDEIFRPSGTASYLLLLVLAPMTFFFADGSKALADPGACILYRPGHPQHYRAEREFFNSYVHFFCPDETIDAFGLPVNTLFSPANTDALDWLIRQIHMEYIAGRVHSGEMISCYLMQLLILLQRSTEVGIVAAPKERAEIYTELLSLRDQMLGNCAHPWSVEELCGILNIGKSQLYKYYRTFFHSTPKEELLGARIQKARYLLESGTASVKEIAYASGFETISHFNRIFKKRCGCAPGAFRNI